MSEALRITIEDLTHAAAELRRLHALNAELVEALRGWMNQPEDAATYDDCMARAEAALAKVEASK